ncbi:MAG: hypothetical protein CL908_06410 [Deltaproteobacteria bacterium]|nr:hypothetical protein [Deltaproteobacteria bacterium]
MRDRIEAALERLGHLLYARAVWVIGGALLVVALGAGQIANIELRVSTDEFLREDDPVRVEYDDFLERFGRDDVIIVAIEPPDVFDLGFLTRLRALHEELEDNIPHLRDIQSLVNARETRGVNDELIVGELMEDWPETEEELASIRLRALANPLYEGFILAKSGRLTTITIELEAFSDFYDAGDALAGFDDEAPEASSGETGDERFATRLTGTQEAEIIETVNTILARYDAPDFEVYAGGTPLMNSALMGSMIRDISLFTLLSILTIAIFLAIVFRRALAIAVPLVVALLSVVATLGAMGTFGIPAMPISEIVPSFLLAVGVGGTVHILVIFRQQLDAGASREDAIAGALGHSGLPIIMTSVTTAGGLLSFVAAELVPIVIFGTIAPLGILVTLLLTLTLAPALIAVLPFKPEPSHATSDLVSIRLLTRVGVFATDNAGRVLGSCAALAVLAVVGMLRLELSFDSLAWFPDDLPAKVASRKLDRELGGAVSLEMLIETGEEDGLHDPKLLHRIDRARHTVADIQVGDVIAGKSISLIDVVKEIHQALNGGTEQAHAIPGERALISQELLLFENSGSDDLEDLVDSQFSQARFTMRLPMIDAAQYPAFADEVERIFDAQLEGLADARLTGMMVVMGRSFVASIETLIRSYGIALAVITPLMMLLLGSVRLGLIAMIPNLFPILLTLGLMGWVGIPIEMFSLLIGSVALGLAVDDTIHFMHGFRRGYANTGDVPEAVRRTLRTTGQALLFTSIILSVAFFTYVLSDLTNLKNFGIMTAFAIVVAFLADILLAPALMTFAARFSSIRAKASEAS